MKYPSPTHLSNTDGWTRTNDSPECAGACYNTSPPPSALPLSYVRLESPMQLSKPERRRPESFGREVVEKGLSSAELPDCSTPHQVSGAGFEPATFGSNVKYPSPTHLPKASDGDRTRESGLEGRLVTNYDTLAKLFDNLTFPGRRFMR